MRYIKQLLVLSIVILSGLQASPQSIPPSVDKLYGPFYWIDSLSTLWSVQNADLTLPFKAAGKADSRREMSISLDPKSVKKALDTIIPGFPLPYNEAVAYYIDLLSQHKAAATEILLGYSQHSQAFIDTLVSNYQMPGYFRHLVSGGSNHYYRSATSTGASGPWLLPYLTARRYGLRIDSYVDERRNITQSAQAAFRMISDMHEIYGDWMLALGAYYCGPANVNKAIRRAGGRPDYWDIYPFLPDPERAYVPALVATAFIFEYYDRLGLVPLDMVWPGVPDTVLVKNQVSLTDAAELLSLPVNLLRELNPEYRMDIIPGQNGALPLRLPEGNMQHYLTKADSARNLPDAGLKITEADPPVLETSATVATPAASNSQSSKGVPVYYTVKPGDNLGLISGWFDVKISNIKVWNHIRGDVIKAGERLVIYVPERHESYYLKINKLTLAQKKALKGPGQGQSGSVAADKPSSPGSTTRYTTYTVKQGDNPTSIASKFPGVSVEEILKANGITDPRRLYVGQKLKIPLRP